MDLRRGQLRLLDDPPVTRDKEGDRQRATERKANEGKKRGENNKHAAEKTKGQNAKFTYLGLLPKPKGATGDFPGMSLSSLRLVIARRRSSYSSFESSSSRVLVGSVGPEYSHMGVILACRGCTLLFTNKATSCVPKFLWAASFSTAAIRPSVASTSSSETS